MWIGSDANALCRLTVQTDLLRSGLRVMAAMQNQDLNIQYLWNAHLSLETRAFGANKERTLLRYKPFTIKETTFSLLALLPIILVFYGRISWNSFVPLDGFSLTPFVGSSIVIFCGSAFLSIIFGATFAIRLLGKK